MGIPSGSPGYEYAGARVFPRPLGMSGGLGQADRVGSWFVPQVCVLMLCVYGVAPGAAGMGAVGGFNEPVR